MSTVNPLALTPEQKGERPPATRGELVIRARHRGWATFLALIGGAIGLHKFYLNRPGWGLIYFLFFWTGIPMIAAFIEAIIYAVTDEQQFQRNYPPC